MTYTYRQIKRYNNYIVRDSFDRNPSEQWSHNWHSLIRFMIKWLVKWNVLNPITKETVSHYVYGPQQAELLTKAVLKNVKNINSFLDKAEDFTVFLGAQQFHEAMKERSFNFSFAEDPSPVTVPLSGIKTATAKETHTIYSTILGIPVVVIPWFDGYLAVPNSMINPQQLKAVKNVSYGTNLPRK